MTEYRIKGFAKGHSDSGVSRTNNPSIPSVMLNYLSWATTLSKYLNLISWRYNGKGAGNVH